MLRQVLSVVLGHVDAGKTSFLDRIRSTKMQQAEAGGISQKIFASVVTIDTIKGVCGDIVAPFRLSIPGIVFIDTPGHEVFSNLRKRGGSVADIAVVVVDVNKGLEAQTKESINILKEYKVPFIIALNKIDNIAGWVSRDGCFSDNSKLQNQNALNELDLKLYKVVEELYLMGFESERFDRLSDFSKQIVIVPCSVRTGEGVQEVLAFLSGLAQKFLSSKMELHLGEGKGSVIEVGTEPGVGGVMKIVLYDGVLNEGDEVLFFTLDGVVKSKIKGLVEQKETEEKRVEEAVAACGVSVFCDFADKAVSGSPFFVVKNNEEELREKIKSEVEGIIIETNKEGSIVKADALGSLEAISIMFKRAGVEIARAGVGSVTKRDVSEAFVMKSKNKYSALFAFNVSINEDALAEAKSSGIRVFSTNIIYQLVDDYKKWVEEEKQKEKSLAIQKVVLPAKIKILKCFRANNPCILGVEVLEGVLRNNCELMDVKGKLIGRVTGVQSEKRNIERALRGEQVAISIEGCTFGRHVFDDQVLYSKIPEGDFPVLEKISENKDLVEEIKRIQKFVS
jgi:translation initiation factor 5B